MSDQTTTERARPEAIKAVPVRHPGRWLAIAVLVVLTAMFVHLLVTNDQFRWSFIFSSYEPGKHGVMFTGPVLEGLRGTLLLTVTSMLIGVVFVDIIAVIRLTDTPILHAFALSYSRLFLAVFIFVLALPFG